MARQARVDVPNIPYHVINRVVGKLGLLTQSVEKTGNMVTVPVSCPRIPRIPYPCVAHENYAVPPIYRWDVNASGSKPQNGGGTVEQGRTPL